MLVINLEKDRLDKVLASYFLKGLNFSHAGSSKYRYIRFNLHLIMVGEGSSAKIHSPHVGI